MHGLSAVALRMRAAAGIRQTGEADAAGDSAIALLRMMRTWPGTVMTGLMRSARLTGALRLLA